MLYLDYSREAGEWIPNVHGGRENLEAIAFIRELNTLTFGEHPGATTFAEESTAWPQVSRPVDGGGLGFGYKWNMGWMHDTLDYMRHEPVHRRYHHHQMTFGIHYAFTENFVLPLSHDEVVHGKGSLLAQDAGRPLAEVRQSPRLFRLHVDASGQEAPLHGRRVRAGATSGTTTTRSTGTSSTTRRTGSMQDLVRDLNRLYRELPALHVKDCEPAGFEWIDGSDADNSVFSFLRHGDAGDPPVLVVCNFTPVVREGYPGRRAARAAAGRSGSTPTPASMAAPNVGNSGGVVAEPVAWNGRPQSITLTLPPLATMIFVHASDPRDVGQPAVHGSRRRAALHVDRAGSWQHRPMRLGASRSR